MYAYYCFIALGVASILLVISLTLIITIQCGNIARAPPDVPWVGLRNRRVLPKLRATLDEFLVGTSRIEEGYEKYLKHGKAFVLPCSHFMEVVLPPSDIKWIVSHTDEDLSVVKVQDDIMALHLLAHGPHGDAVHDFGVIRREVTRNIAKIVPDLFDEVRAAFSEQLKNVKQTEWKEAQMLKCIPPVSERASDRIFFGQKLCRDKSFERGVWIWFVAFSLGGAIYRYMTPRFAKPTVGRWLAVPVHATQWWAGRKLLPTVRQRLQQLQVDEKSGKPLAHDGRTNDLVQWIVEDCVSKRDPAYLKPIDIAGKALLVDLFAVHTTTLTASQVLVAILNHPSAQEILDELRKEADQVFPLDVDPASINAMSVRNMLKLDACIRECLRTEPGFTHGLRREVMRPGGLTSPSGVYLPQGSHVATLQPDLFDEQGHIAKFDPLPAFKAIDALATPSGAEGTAGRRPKMSVEVSDEYLPFSLGKHACPGRFFAVNNLKVVLGYLVTRYDLMPFEKKPKMLTIGELTLAKSKTKFKVRLRQWEEHDDHQQASSTAGAAL